MNILHDFNDEYEQLIYKNLTNYINENGNNIFHMFSTLFFTILGGYYYYIRSNSLYKIERDFYYEYNVIDYQPDRDEIKNALDNYIEVIKIRRFFDNIENKEKLFNIYNNEFMTSSIFNVLTDYNDKLYIETNKYTNYYKKKLSVETEYIHINIKELYEEEQSIFIDKDLFDIKNNKGYYRIYDYINNKYIYTNFAKLNVYKWIIELGIYDIFYDSLN